MTRRDDENRAARGGSDPDSPCACDKDVAGRDGNDSDWVTFLSFIGQEDVNDGCGGESGPDPEEAARRASAAAPPPDLASENLALQCRIDELESGRSLQEALTDALRKEAEEFRDQLDQLQKEKDEVTRQLRKENEEVESLKAAVESENLALRRRIDELESVRSLQEVQMEILRKESEQMHNELVRSQEEKERSTTVLREENDAVEAQKQALESYLVDLNETAGSLREGRASTDDACPVHAVEAAALRDENEALRSSVESLRKSLVLVERERMLAEEEAAARLECREGTIVQLEGSLARMQAAARSRFSKKSSRGSVKSHHNTTPVLATPESPDKAGGH